ncbi:hypothetical protein PG994_010609 [Apiospora phragmitis]|uniref:BZIP domain-containing protein n=1 Tax=Apiospora phragmitis TaxID=2905665 RepID=A0ABR1TQI3_9PEZI
MATQSQGGHGGMDDNEGGLRPSFTRFWKRLKPQPGPRRHITFVSANPGPAGPDSDPLSQQQHQQQHDEGAGSKAGARRAQDRRAQIQHRQRKANYAKELEADIVRLRGDIKRCKGDCRASRATTRACSGGWPPPLLWLGHRRGKSSGSRWVLALRDRSVVAEIDCPMTVAESGDGGISNSLPPPPPRGYGGDADAAAVWAASSSFSFEPDYLAYLDVNENLGSPAFQVTRRTKADQEGYPYFAEEVRTPGPTLGVTDDQVAELGQGSEEETDRAINFILAYELPCRAPQARARAGLVRDSPRVRAGGGAGRRREGPRPARRRAQGLGQVSALWGRHRASRVR